MKTFIKYNELSSKRIYRAVGNGLLASLLSVLVSITLARTLTFHNFGEFASAKSILTVLGLICSLGLGSQVITIYRGASRDYMIESEARAINHYGPIIILIASTLGSLVVILAHSILFKGEGPVDLIGFVIIVSLGPVYSLIRFYMRSAAAHGSSLTASLITGWGADILFLVIISIVSLQGSSHIGVVLMANIYVLTSVVILACCLILVKNVEPPYLRQGIEVLKLKQWLKVGLMFTLTPITLSVLENAGIIVMTFIHTDIASTSLLAAAASIGILIFPIAMNLRALFTPVLVEAINNKNKNEILFICSLWYKSILSFLIPATILLAYLTPYLLKLYGIEFSGALWTTIVYLICYFLGGLNLLLLPLNQYLGYQLQTAMIMAISCLLGVIAMVFLGYIWNDLGIAIATSISINTGLIVTGIFAIKNIEKWQYNLQF